MTKRPAHPLDKILEHRIAIIDGAMGTTIRTYGMKEADIRGKRFKNVTKDLLNNGDLFSLTQPKMIGDIHRRFLEAGADIIETNTFGATSIVQSEFFVDDPRERGGRKDPEFYQQIIDDASLGNLAWEITHPQPFSPTNPASTDRSPPSPSRSPSRRYPPSASPLRHPTARRANK